MLRSPSYFAITSLSLSWGARSRRIAGRRQQSPYLPNVPCVTVTDPDSLESQVMSDGSEGSPQTDDIDSLLAIFTISTLRGLKKHCRGAIISESELANFIMWCKSDGPFLHSAHHRQFVPEHLTLSDSDLAALAANGVGRFKPAAQKVANKVQATFDERRLLSGHLFWSAQTWHFFYFDNHDRDRYKNHWVGSPHIHVINHLWPNQSAEAVWEQFCNGNPIMRGALHIRLSRIDYGPPADGSAK